MTNLNQQKAQPALFRGIAIILMGLAAIMTAGCAEERDTTDGQLTNTIILPTDTLLNLACEWVGVNGETCVLDDPENPFASILSFDKFELFDSIPGGPAGAKARFYLWATALARAPSGENQWYTARALHELYTYNGDELIRLQALKAYRSNLAFFFGSVSYFDVFGFGIPGTLNEQVACDIYRPPAGYAEICLNEAGSVCNDLGKLELIGSWGFAFKPGPNPDGDCPAGSVVEVINFP